MNPVKFPEQEAQNFNLTANGNPNTMDMPACLCLADHLPGVVSYVSKWELDDNDIQQIIKDRSIYITMMHSPVPVLPTTFPPFEIGYTPVTREMLQKAMDRNKKKEE